jgi:glucose/arabinose dehydrogenase
MKYISVLIVITAAIILLIGKDYVCFTVESGSTDKKLSSILLPEGFRIAIYADGISGVRSLTLGEKGTIFAGTRNEGKVYALLDDDGDFKSDRMFVIADGLTMPNGVAFYKGSLFVAEVSRVLRFDNIENRLKNPPEPVVVNDKFPRDRHHGWKYIAFGPDNKLYVPVGAPCNICESKDKRYASIMRMNPDGSSLEIFAHGVRNTVGFDWHPESKSLWFTDNGRDWLGNDLPPDELNNAPEKGMHFGYPYCHGKRIEDPEFGDKRKCSEFTEPQIELGAHVASLGMKFYNGRQFPAAYRGRIFITEHGSWNRNPPSGYRITMVTLKNGKADSYSIFAQGWLNGTKVSGRPVDLLILPDGSMLVSDDMRGVIYRVWYSG